jgi:hypothetical protein
MGNAIGVGFGNFFATLSIVLMIHGLRMQLRARYQFYEPQENMGETCMVICCPQLAIAQDARHVQNSIKAGYELPLAGAPIGIMGRGSFRPQPEIVPFSGAAHRLGDGTETPPPASSDPAPAATENNSTGRDNIEDSAGDGASAGNADVPAEPKASDTKSPE